MTETATVEVLTAEVRVLMVGSRQVTLSVAKQLDEVDPDDIEPFGRIRTGKQKPFAAVRMIEVIGCYVSDGSLVRSIATEERFYCASNGTPMSRATVNGRDAIYLRCSEHPGHTYSSGHFWLDYPDAWINWEMLPLIVLAGLR